MQQQSWQLQQSKALRTRCNSWPKIPSATVSSEPCLLMCEQYCRQAAVLCRGKRATLAGEWPPSITLFSLQDTAACVANHLATDDTTLLVVPNAAGAGQLHTGLPKSFSSQGSVTSTPEQRPAVSPESWELEAAFRCTSVQAGQCQEHTSVTVPGVGPASCGRQG